MTEQKFQITVKDSVFQTKGAGLHMCLLFAVCFLFQFMVYIILANPTGCPENLRATP